jgi:bifunctional non-homologous end joining protein LigD
MRAEPSETVMLDGHAVKITRPSKVLFPESGITKRDVVRYYEWIGPRMLPYLQDRPLALQRFPDGTDGPGFFQKAAAAYYPSWIRRATVPKAGGTVTHVISNDVATLVYLANQAAITLHTCLSRRDELHHPDQMIFDLDPAVRDVPALVEAALALKKVLDELELPAYVKSTGSRGLHITVPLDHKLDFDTVRAFARAVAGNVAAKDPAKYTLEQLKSKRNGRIFFDVNRNAYAQTAVAVYSLRPQGLAPVSVPLHWSELRQPDFRPDGVVKKTLRKRLETIEDPWKDFWRSAASLDKARRKLERVHAA